MALDERRLAFIGAGHITNIILDNLVKAEKLHTHRVIASDPEKNKLQRLHDKYEIIMAQDNMEAVDKGDFIFINVPPQVVGDVIDELSRKRLAKNKLVVTLAAGIPITAYESLGDNTPVVRALPNPPSQIGKGIAALAFNPHVTDDQKKDIFEIFACLGDHVVIREDLVNAVMALSSPSITYMLFQSLIDAGIRAGIDHETATKIVSQTIVGAMEVWQQRNVLPHELLTEASTPGGISIESLYTLETYAFKAGIMEAVDSAINRAVELSQSVK